MPAETRKSNKDASFKVYYSKKIPQQKYFPHRRKIVRHKEDVASAPLRDPRQMTFLPEMMRAPRNSTQNTPRNTPRRISEGVVGDSEEDEEEEEEDMSSLEPEGEVGSGSGSPEKRKRSIEKGGRKEKRDSDVVKQEEGEEDEDPVLPAPKRRRAAANKPRRAPARPKSTATTQNSSAAPEDSEHEELEPSKPRLRRQSTMTQFVEERRPGSEDEEPVFKPVKRSSTTRGKSKGSKGRDKKQRTLTQMVPRAAPVEDSEEETEEDVVDDGAYDNALAEHLTRSGVFESFDGTGDGRGEDATENSAVRGGARPWAEAEAEAIPRAEAAPGTESEAGREAIAPEPASLESVLQINMADIDEDTEDDYFPTQHIEAPTLTSRRTSRRISKNVNAELASTAEGKSTPKRAKKSRFGQLATPERRKIHEIPSSQSPPQSPLSAFASPATARSPLKPRSGNVQDTPSKRKQVTFQDRVAEVEPRSAPRRKFGSMVQDSEDEDENEEELETQETEENQEEEFDIGAETQAIIDGIEQSAPGRDIGAETQALLGQIDQACANAEEDVGGGHRDSSEELGAQEPQARNYEESQELGIQWNGDDTEDVATSTEHGASYRSEQTGIKREVEETEESTPTLPVASVEHHELSGATGSVDVQRTLVDSTEILVPTKVKSEPNTHPPLSPIPIDDAIESADEAPQTPQHALSNSIQHSLSNPTQPPHSNPTQHPPSHITVDLDGHPLATQSQRPDTQNSTHSHSSKAEQQLHSESWLPYTQLANLRNQGPPSASMAVVQDTSNYQATPFPNPAICALAPPAWSAHGSDASQATTCVMDDVDVDGEIGRSPFATPRKPRSGSRVGSAHTTPHGRTGTANKPNSNRTPRRPHIQIPSSPLFVSPVRPDSLVIPSSFPSPGRVSMRDWSSPVLGSSPALRTQGEFGLGSVEDFSIPGLPPTGEWEDDDDE